MKILYISKYDPTPWQRKIEKILPEADFLLWPDEAPDDLGEIDYVLTWKPEPGVLALFPKLKAIFNMGAGVDALLADKTLPQNVPIVRLVDPLLTSGMVEYVAHWVLHFHRQFHIYGAMQKKREWKEFPPPFTAKRAIGFLGIGELGYASAQALQNLGFKNIAGWSRNKKQLPGIESFSGLEELETFLNRTEILITLLPLTSETEKIINAKTISLLPTGACIINPGRGGLINDDDLIAALKSGKIAAAALDVFSPEPLDEQSPYWEMENVFVTPHIASLTVAGSAASVTAEMIKKIEAGGKPENTVDLSSGY
ncbi:MAG: glyoxylate/hydroxypyruvate reductase A [Rhodospirillaceae bacterium]|nr:glyoxylate/hydroxypyruvate reductase A [Rhodospirillaceae bacterium]